MTNTILTILQLVLISAQFIFLVIGYKLASRHFRMSKASSFLERFLSKEMIEYRNTVDELFSRNDLKFALEHLKDPENLDDLNHVRAFANFFQELGIAYRRKLVDKDYVKDVFDHLTCKYWNLLIGWINDYRNIDPSLYRKWEDLRDELRNVNPKLKQL